MALIHPGNLIAVQISHGLRYLSGTEVAAVSKDGNQIPEDRVDKLRVVTGERPEMSRPVEPSVGVDQDIQQVHRRHLLTYQLADERQIFRRRSTIEFLQDRLTVLDTEAFILRECGIDSLRRLAQPFAQMVDKFIALCRQPGLPAIFRSRLVKLSVTDELISIIGEPVAPLYHEIPVLQAFGDRSEDAHFKITPIDFLDLRRAFLTTCHLFPPAIGNPVEIAFPFGRIDLQPLLPILSMALHKIDRPLKALIPARRDESEFLDDREEN